MNNYPMEYNVICCRNTDTELVMVTLGCQPLLPLPTPTKEIDIPF